MCSNPNDSYQNSKGLSNIAPRFIWVPIVATNMYKKNSSYFGRTIAFDFFLALVNDKATPTVVVIMTNQKNSLVKEYFSNWDNCL
jgi:hypothetical protein